MISFLELTPKPATETVTLDTDNGKVDVEVSGLSLVTLAELVKRFPAFGKLIEGGNGSLIETSEAMPALIAAGLGHPGAAEYEAKARELNALDMLSMFRAIMRLTLPATPETPASPLPDEPALVNGGGRPLDPISQSRLSNFYSGNTP